MEIVNDNSTFVEQFGLESKTRWSSFDARTVITAVVSVTLASVVAQSIYRLYFHPLAKYPGSKWAALSTWYDVYWNIYQPGQLIFEIKRLHDVHGPAVRIGPNELHIADPAVHYQMFKPGTKCIKDHHHYDSYCLPESLPGMVERAEVRKRREAYRPMFGRKSVQTRWPQLVHKAKVLLGQLSKYDRPVEIQDALSSFSLDMISEMTFSKDFHATSVPGFKHPFIKEAQEAAAILWPLMLFPNLRKIVLTLEPYFTAIYKRLKTTKQTATLALLDNVQATIENYWKLKKEGKVENATGHKNVIDHFMDPKAARNWVIPSLKSLTEESVGILAGATETTATTNTFALYYIVNHPEVMKKLQAEVDEYIPDPLSFPEWETMEKMPYLTAVVFESFRMACPLPGRIPREIGEGGLLVQGKYLPKGVVVSASAYTMHRQPNLFEDPEVFNPERWLQPDSKNLKQFYIPFSKGVGECPGKQLAYAEVYTIIANVFRWFDVSMGPGMSAKNMLWNDSITIRLSKPKLALNFKVRSEELARRIELDEDTKPFQYSSVLDSY